MNIQRYPKWPKFGQDELEVVNNLNNQGIPVNVTCCFTEAQLELSKLGSKYHQNFDYLYLRSKVFYLNKNIYSAKSNNYKYINN